MSENLKLGRTDEILSSSLWFLCLVGSPYLSLFQNKGIHSKIVSWFLIGSQMRDSFDNRFYSPPFRNDDICPFISFFFIFLFFFLYGKTKWFANFFLYFFKQWTFYFSINAYIFVVLGYKSVDSLFFMSPIETFLKKTIFLAFLLICRLVTEIHVIKWPRKPFSIN